MLLVGRTNGPPNERSKTMGYGISEDAQNAMTAAGYAAVPVPVVPMRDCPKCGGSGLFRSMTMEGVCFRCGGDRQVATVKGQRVLNQAKGARETIRLRLMWAATRDALKVAKAGADAPKVAYIRGGDNSHCFDRVNARAAVRDLPRRLESLKAKGEMMVELAANPHGRWRC